MRKVYNISIIYTFMMAVGLFVCKHLYNVTYGDERNITILFPFLLLLLPFSVITFNKYKKEIKNPCPKYKLFMILFLPIVFISIFTIIQKAEFSYSFFITLIGALLVGINEELVYRGIVFTNAVEEKGVMKGIFISAIIFSLLHAVNIFAGLTPLDVVMQLITTFISGLFFAVSYRYTKNIWLLVIFHGLWDYILFSGIGKLYSAVNIMMGVLFVAELIITFVLIGKYKKEFNNMIDCKIKCDTDKNKNP